jgi:S-adenosylmethionine-diacylglycerol 3-amino-3-carboxypropyl transferase
VARIVGVTGVRYAQCWEDADVLVAGLDVQPGDTCLSIASAGDNTLALLARHPRRVIAVDYRPEQIACLELRVSAYRTLAHPELLELVGSRPSTRRELLYRRCRPALSAAARDFWDANPRAVADGIGNAGKFERYLAAFRKRVLPLVHSHRTVEELLKYREPVARREFYDRTWDGWRWRLLYRLFFSRWLMARLGRDPACFEYAARGIAAQLLERSRNALSTQDLAENAYLQWICTGRHATALPFALRAENFDAIRANLGQLEWQCTSLERLLDSLTPRSVDRFNLSDVFEYLSPAEFEAVMRQLACVGRPGGRLMYWNLFATRRRPEFLAGQLRPLASLAEKLRREDQTFFYGGLVIEEITTSAAEASAVP